MSIFVNRSDKLGQSDAHMALDNSKLFITFILQNLGKQRHLMTISEMGLHALDDTGSPLDDQ
jgi:hypothetical protein